MKKYFEPTAIILTVFIFFSILYGCTKSSNVTQATSSVKTAVALATTAKTTVKSTSKTAASSTGAEIAASGTGQSATTESDNPEGTSSADSNSGTQENGVNSSDVSTGDIAEKKFDLKGREIKVIVSNLKAPMEAPYDDGTRLAEVKAKMLKESEEKYNCKFVFEQYVSWTILQRDIENAVMAGVYYCDSFRMVRSFAFPKYEKLNIIIPLNDYIDFDKPVYKKYDQINGLLYPEKIYAFYISMPLTPIGVFYNKDILSREGLPDIQGIASEGNWNWNTLVDIAVRTTRDFEGDGIIDQWGIGSDNAFTLCTALMRSNLAAMVDHAGGGNYVYNLQSPKALKALQFASDLYHSFKVAKPTSVLTDFRNGKAAMYVKDAWYGANLKNFGLNGVGFEIIPDGPDNPGNAYMREQGSHMFFFPATLTDPEAVVNAMAHWNVLWDDTKSDYLTDEDMLISSALSYFDNDANVNNFIKMIKTRKIQYDYVEFFETVGKVRTLITNNVYNKIAAASVAPMSDIEAIKYEVQSIISQQMER